MEFRPQQLYFFDRPTRYGRDTIQEVAVKIRRTHSDRSALPIPPVLRVLCALSLGTALLGACTDSESDLPRLEFPSDMPSELVVGDTTEELVMIRYFANTQGQERSTDDYRGHTFTSSDTAVVKVIENRRLLGLKPGTSDISASDGAGSDTRKPFTVTVANP